MKLFHVHDNLEKYHPFAVDYRKPGSALPEKLSGITNLDPRSTEDILKFTQSLSNSYNRVELTATLLKNNELLGASEQTIQNINALNDKKSFVIVAGHQPSLFGGQLFLTMKIISAINLCAKLNSESEYNFIPAYWNASEEHNQSEFLRISFFDNEHDSINLTLPPVKGRVMAAETPVDAATALLNELRKLLPQTEFTQELCDEISSIAKNSSDLGEIQSRLMLKWFSKHGLVIVEPRMLRELSAPIIKQELETAREGHECLHNDTEGMKKLGYSPPLPLHESERTRVYYIEGGKRYRVRTEGDDFSLETLDRHFSKPTMMKLLADHPDRFSPSAALRPIIQSYVLPVSVYVAGGGELSYHMQLRSYFKHFKTKMPIIFPRAAATILKKNMQKTFDAFSLDINKTVSTDWEWETLHMNAAETESNRNSAFEYFSNQFNQIKNKLMVELNESGAKSTKNLEHECDKFMQRISKIESNLSPSESDEKALRRRYHRLRKFALPRNSYQELSCWTLYFLAQFGESILDDLINNTNPLSDNHHLFFAG